MRNLSEQMARIDVRVTWATIPDFETRIPQAVDDLVRTTSTQA